MEPQKTTFNKIELDKKAPHRQIGFGATPGATKDEKIRRFIGAMKRNMQCPSVNVPNIDTVTVHYDGPLSNANTLSSFGAVINPLGASVETPPPGASQVDSTFAEPGKFQTFALVCAIQWRYDVDPIAFTAKCNGVLSPTVASAKPVSPDAFVAQVGGAGAGDLAASGVLGNTSMVPAILEWAWWAEMAFFYMSRGYNLQWQYGHSFNLLNDKLHYTAYLPSSAQNGSASSSEIDLQLFLNRVNTYYTNTLGSPYTALLIDRMRAGNSTLGGTAGLSTFHPSRAFETVGGTYGGTGLQSLLQGNSEFRRLAVPFLAWPGVPLGLKAQVQSSVDQVLMQKYLDATCGFGGTAPASFTESSLVNTGNSVAGTSGTTGVELSLDPAGALSESLEMLAQRAIFKGSPWRITVGFKGWELSPDQAEMIRQEEATRTMVSQGCGCMVSGPMGAGA
jgi:hypothetical protein